AVARAASGPRVDGPARPRLSPPGGGSAIGLGVPRSEVGETILRVEGGEALRDVLQRVLEEFGYRVCVAKDGEEALSVSDAHDGPIHLLVTDVVMPHMGGRELAVELWGRRP